MANGANQPGLYAGTGAQWLQPVTAVLAESDASQLKNICLYAGCQRAVRLGGVATGERALETLCGSRPEVLVLDALIQNMGLFELLGELPRLHLERRPAILVTGSLRSQKIQERLLTLGVDFIMLKPYKLSELFKTIVMLGADLSTLSARRISEHLNWYLDALRADYSTNGVWYIVLAEQVLIPRRESCPINEVYRNIAEREHISPDAAATAIHRAIAHMWAAHSEQYLQMCAYLAFSGEKPLPNAEFLGRLAQMIRQELCL